MMSLSGPSGGAWPAAAVAARVASARRRTMRERSPSSRSVLMPRSCASSSTMAEYFESSKSSPTSRSNTPSVMNLRRQREDTVES
eukprot:scaffold5615_cov103-Isochrysis_galbana.AAC.10